MRPNPPPFAWLRAFEATARHLSMTRAAAELHISASAISQQITALEAYFGRPLFRRANRKLTLTASGALIAPKLSAGLTLIHEAIDDALPARRRQNLLVRVTTSFGSQWLMHRLDSFRAVHPNITAQVTATTEPIENEKSAAEIEIRYGKGEWPGLVATKLVEEQLFPVCSPALRAKLKSLASLKRHDLIDVPGYEVGWSDWLEAAGVEFAWMEKRIAVDQSVMAIQLALDGKGIALGRSPLIERELADGRLVAPFPRRIESGGGYWIVHRQRPSEARKILAFKDWLLAQAKTAPLTRAASRSSRS